MYRKTFSISILKSLLKALSSNSFSCTEDGFDQCKDELTMLCSNTIQCRNKHQTLWHSFKSFGNILSILPLGKRRRRDPQRVKVCYQLRSKPIEIYLAHPWMVGLVTEISDWVSHYLMCSSSVYPRNRYGQWTKQTSRRDQTVFSTRASI